MGNCREEAGKPQVRPPSFSSAAEPEPSPSPPPACLEAHALRALGRASLEGEVASNAPGLRGVAGSRRQAQRRVSGDVDYYYYYEP